MRALPGRGAVALAGVVALAAAAVVAATVPAQAAVADVAVVASSDDAEETSTGSVSLSSSVLELGVNGSPQTVGVRFAGVPVPRGSVVTAAWVQFTSGKAATGATTLTVAGVAADSTPTFSKTTAGISSRPRTAATVTWVPAGWTTSGAAGTAQRTPDLSAVVQEVVDRPGWAAGNAVAVVVTGTGRRNAKSFDGGGKPVLHVEYAPRSGPNTAPVVSAGPDTSAVAGGRTPGLPGHLEGIEPEAQGELGPWTDGHGALYTVVEDFLANGNRPKAMKSVDGGATWAQVDAAGRTTTGDLEAVWTVQVGTRVWMLWQKSSGHVQAAAFATSDAATGPDTWVVPKEAVHTPGADPGDQVACLVARSNGDLVAFYATDRSSVGGQTGIRVRSAATGLWGAQTVLDPARSTSQVVAVRGAGDAVEVFYADQAARQVLHRTLAADGTLGPVTRVDAAGTVAVFNPMTNAVVVGSGAAQRVVVAYADPGAVLRSVTYDPATGAVSAPEQVSDGAVVVNPGITTNVSAVAHLVVDGTTVHAFLADAATADIWHDVRVDGGTWGPDVLVGPDLTVQWLDGLAVRADASGRRVIGMLYDVGPHPDDGGDIRYDELPLAGGGASASLRGSVTDDGLPAPPAALTTSWSVVSGPGTVTFAAPSAPSTLAWFTAPGEYVLRLTASDGELSASDDVTVVVTAGANLAPVVRAGPDATVAPGTALALAGSVSDDGLPDGTLTAGWQQVSGPGTAFFADPAAAATSVTFDLDGTYVLRLTGSDGALSASDDVTVTVGVLPPVPTVREVSVAAGSDDAEESVSSGSVSLTSSDLELTEDGGAAQTVGMRFAGLDVPRGAHVTAAWLQFTVDEVSTGAVQLRLTAQAADDAATFTTAARGVSSRPRTAAWVDWVPPDWPTVGLAGAAQRTPDLSALVQEVVSRPGWAPGHALVVLVDGTGRRTAEAFEGTARVRLHVEYLPG